MSIYQIMKELEQKGYYFQLKPGPVVDINLLEGYKKPEPEEVRLLFNKLKNNKSKVVEILKLKEQLNPLPLWFVIKSGTLEGQKILLIKDNSVKIPYKYRKLDRYTYKEVLEFKGTKEDLKLIHTVKNMFNGKMITANTDILDPD